MIDKDVRVLARLGWFESIQVEATPSTAPFPQSPVTSTRATLIFHMQELPFLSKVEYSGSRLLSQNHVEKLLAGKKLDLPMGKRANRVLLQRTTLGIR